MEKLIKYHGKNLSTNDFTDKYKEKVDKLVEGTRGYSNYELAAMNGFKGTEQEYLDSFKGEKGDKGDTGGVNSVNGMQGEVVIGNATENVAGLMSQADKKKLDKNLINKQSTVELTSTIQANTDYTIPLNYQVSNNSLEVFHCGEKLKKGIDYVEVGEEGAISNTVQFTSNLGDLDMSSVEGFEDFAETLEFVVRGDYSV